MKKIKEILIHWLGGYTAAEYEQNSQEFLELGYAIRNIGIKKFADSLYGLNAEDWCERMYKFIMNEHGNSEEEEI